MAPAAASGTAAWIAALWRSMAPFPGRVGFALRLALCCTITAFVAVYYGTPEAALTTYLVFFLNKPDRTSSFITAAATTALFTAVVGLLLLLAKVVLEYPAWRLLAMASLSFVLLFLASASKLKPIGGTLALVTAYALDVLGSAPMSELVTRGLLYAWLCVAIPAGVSAVVALLLAPAPRHLVQAAFAQRLEVAARVLRRPTAGHAEEVTTLLRAGNSSIAGRLKLAGLEDKANTADLAYLARAMDSTWAMLATLAFMLSDPRATLHAEVRTYLADEMDRRAKALRRGKLPCVFEAAAVTMFADGTLAGDVHAALSNGLNFQAKGDAPSPPPAQPKGGFLLADAFTNPVHTQYAIKTTAAAMACYLLYSLTSWPGIHTCLITCYIVSLGTLAESVRKLSLRIAGCLVGAALGLLTMIFVIPHVATLAPYLLLLFVGALPATWVAAGGERISYAGFQIAFAFFLCVIQGDGPEFDMVVARDRVIGILIGIGVVYVVSSCVWPVGVRRRLDAAMLQLDRLTSLLSRSTSAGQARSLAIQAKAAQVALVDDIELAQLEPDWIRPSAEWLAACSEVAARSDEAILALTVQAELQTHASEALRSLARDRLDAVPRVSTILPTAPENSLDPT